MDTDVNPGTRRHKAEATRRKILRAAHEEFLATGYHGATMAAIAKRAGVAVQTVYFVFHTKAELISAVIDTAVMGEEEPTRPEETAWWAAMQEESDAAEVLRIFVRGASPLFERGAAISEVLRGAALTDPELRATHDAHETLRREGFRHVIELVAERDALRQGLDIGTATDVFLTVFGDAVWHQLRADCGWPADRVTEWMCDVLPRMLVA